MKVTKEYNTAKKKKGNVCFGAVAGGRWMFRISDKESGSLEKILKITGGYDVAEKIALVISKAWLKTANKKLDATSRLDGRSRQTIDRLCGLRTLADWKGEPEWWSNRSDGMPAVNVIYVNHPKAAPVVEAEPPVGISAEDLTPAVEAPVETQELVPA